MKCLFCQLPVYGGNGMTVPGRGLSHRKCFEADALMRHSFKGLDLSSLEDNDLKELDELVAMEKRSRERTEHCGDSEDEIELF